MVVRFHAHAQSRMTERGATVLEVQLTIATGEAFPAKFGRVGFRRNFHFEDEWRGTFYQTKQVEAYAVHQDED